MSEGVHGRSSTEHCLALQDRGQLNAVRLDTEAGTLVLAERADFDPVTLHDWPQVHAELARRAAEWDPPAEQRANKRMEPTRRCRKTERGSFATLAGLDGRYG